MPEVEKRPIYKNVSIEELNRILDETKDLEERLNLAIYYVSCYDLDGKANCSVAQLVNAAKENILKAVVDEKIKFKQENGYYPLSTSFSPVDPTKATFEMGSFFLKNPMMYVANSLKMISMAPVDMDTPADLLTLRSNANTLCDVVFSEKALKEYAEIDKMNRPNGLIAGVSQKQLGRKNGSAKDILEPHKGGFFERWRKKTSPEYLKFKDTFENYNNPESECFGDLDALERDTKAYLVHKIPGYDPDTMPTQEQINRLSGTGKGRAQLCFNVLKTVYEQKNLQNCEEVYKSMETENPIVDLMPEEFAKMYQEEVLDEENEVEKEVENNPQKEFAEKLNEDISKDDELIFVDKEEKDNEKENSYEEELEEEEEKEIK